MNHRVAILGGSGFIGRYIVKRLAERGDVVAVGGRYAAQAKFLKLKGDVGQVGLINIGIDDERLLPAFLAGNDTVINCVGILRESGRQRFDLVHHTAPARLARLAREAGAARFIHVSAIGADPRSTSAYARSKAAGEQAVRDAFPTATILRPAIVFGPEDQFFNRFAALASFAPMLPLIGGKTRFQPVYVGDAAQAVVAGLSGRATEGMVYELGGPAVYTFRELLKKVCDWTQHPRPLLPIPFWAAKVTAFFTQFLPGAPITLDQVRLLQRDNIVSAAAIRDQRTLSGLGIGEPRSIEVIVPPYLQRYRPRGEFSSDRISV